MNDTTDNSIINKLLSLSKMFKHGFTVVLKNNELNQYHDVNKPFIVSYHTILSIVNEHPHFYLTDLPKECIIGGWLDTSNIYYIEIDKAFSYKQNALKYARKGKQRYIFDFNKGEYINAR